MLYRSSKDYGHEQGFSCAFRQPGAASHCNKLHGYALRFRFEFEARTLDKNNWVVDFGSLKPLKVCLTEMFDHTTIVSADDYELSRFQQMQRDGLVSLRVLPAVGIEAFALWAFCRAVLHLVDNELAPRVRVHKVEVWEHPGNSASVINDECWPD